MPVAISVREFFFIGYRDYREKKKNPKLNSACTSLIVDTHDKKYTAILRFDRCLLVYLVSAVFVAVSGFGRVPPVGEQTKDEVDGGHIGANEHGLIESVAVDLLDSALLDGAQRVEDLGRCLQLADLRVCQDALEVGLGLTMDERVGHGDADAAAQNAHLCDDPVRHRVVFEADVDRNQKTDGGKGHAGTDA